MGCDIHGWVEMNDTLSLGWYQPVIAVGAVADRNYSMFALLFGVRGMTTQSVAVERGLPENISDLAKADSAHWESDGHSHSYITWEELQYAMPLLEGSISEGWRCLFDLMERLQKHCIDATSWTENLDVIESRALPVVSQGQPSRVRMVVWFDN